MSEESVIEPTVVAEGTAKAAEKSINTINVKDKVNPPSSSCTLTADEIAHAVTVEGDALKEAGPAPLTTTRFLVQNIEGGRGYANTDYYVDLIYEKHGLYDLVSVVYDILLKENLTYDSITSHLWNVSFAGVTYQNGWRRYCPVGTEFDRPANESDIDEGEPRLLSALPTPLEKGQKGVCCGESAKFDIVVECTSLEKVDEDNISVNIATPWPLTDAEEEEEKKKHSSLPQYPKVTPVSLNISASIEDDWITDNEKARCITVGRAWDVYYTTESSWKRDRRTGEWLKAKPCSPEWGSAERTIIGLLLKSGAKFKQSWTNILQYAFVDRPEPGTSMKWYALKKKDYYMIERIGTNMTNEARIRLAKRLAKKRMMDLLERGSPTNEPHPDIIEERKLKKRGIITDEMSESERKRLCNQYRGIF